MSTLLLEEQLEIPLGIRSLDDFRRWCHSESFPRRGRIDFIGGRVEVDMSPESLYTHGSVKVALTRVLSQLVWDSDLGELYVDRARIASLPADLSAEPDLVFLSHATLDSGRVRLIPKTGRDDDAIEIEGPPDMVAEIISDASVKKDTQRLPDAYYTAGVDELWLIDARKPELEYQIQCRGETGFDAVEPDAEGFQQSVVFGCKFRLHRFRDRRGHWKYDLEMKE